ncbi:SDR family oxidoreductase [Nevskia ramosa]|uniref:SDR family oxidoreductase n=1 Tax=Nevskia ramosa TaxID=64002 RepID=UPI0003B6E1FA|nr:SDR family oxidoreductase [Nevskia ramosa]
MQNADKEALAGVALVTGGARRLGAAIVERVHAAGMNVVIHCRSSRAEAAVLAGALNAQRADSAAVLAADLADDAAVAQLAVDAHARWGRLDALVNNASGYRRTPIGAITPALFDELISSNFKAPLLLIQACLPLFGEHAAVVNILDTLARHARPGFAPYNAAKAALWSLTETLAVELAPRVRVNGVAPGHILWAESTVLSAAQKAEELAQIPAGRLGQPAEIARAVAFLLGPEASYLNGVILPVDGGLRLG